MYNLIHNLPRLVSRCAARGGGGEPNYPRLATVLEPEDGLLVGRSTRPIITSGVVATTGKLVSGCCGGSDGFAGQQLQGGAARNYRWQRLQ